jgi:hypothetical protein
MGDTRQTPVRKLQLRFSGHARQTVADQVPDCSNRRHEKEN